MLGDRHPIASFSSPDKLGRPVISFSVSHNPPDGVKQIFAQTGKTALELAEKYGHDRIAGFFFKSLDPGEQDFSEFSTDAPSEESGGAFGEAYKGHRMPTHASPAGQGEWTNSVSVEGALAAASAAAENENDAYSDSCDEAFGGDQCDRGD